MAETVSVKFAHHWTDRRDPDNPKDVKPGETVDDLSIDHARQVVNARVAVYATKKDAKAAGDPEGPTVADAKAEEKAAETATG